MLLGVGGLATVVLIATIVTAGGRVAAPQYGAIRIGEDGLFVPFSTGDDSTSLLRLQDGFEWHIVRGTWGTLNGTAYVSSTADEPGDALAMLPVPTSMRVSAVLSTVVDGAGLVFGYQDEDNYWSAVVRTRDNYVELRHVGSDQNQLIAASRRGLNLPDGVRLRVHHDADGIAVAVGGTVVIDLPDVPPVPNARAGMLASGAQATEARFDDLTLTNAGDLPSPSTTRPSP